MWKTFLAELKHIFRGNKWRPWEWLFIAIIPFLYGFFYMNAYWDPFSKTEHLRIAIVDLNKTSMSKSFKNEMIEDGKKGLQVGQRTYKFDIVDATDNYQDEASIDNAIQNDKYQAIVMIDKDYEATRQNISSAILRETSQFFVSKISSGNTHVDISDLGNSLEGVLKNLKGQLVTFKNSSKFNYLSSEMTNFGAGLESLELKAVLPGVQEIVQTIQKLVTLANKFTPIDLSDLEQEVTAVLNLISLKSTQSATTTNNGDFINDSKSIGENINTYGFGLAPYFLCIALWAGSIVMLFLIKNERHIKGQNTFKNYFGKSLVWIATAWIQALILTTAITIQGVNLGVAHQWELYALALFIATIFALTVQGIGFIFRYGDMADMAAVILLVIQLTSSSGTFPVQMQWTIFKVLHPVIPFTYAIHAIREIFYEPNIGILFKNIGILLAFPAVMVSISLVVNLHFDFKTSVKHKDGTRDYQSFEIHLDDL